jgi:hypothetical protein
MSAGKADFPDQGKRRRFARQSRARQQSVYVVRGGKSEYSMKFIFDILFLERLLWIARYRDNNALGYITPGADNYFSRPSFRIVHEQFRIGGN